ncbi:alpha/beta hydrolase [Ancylobacter sp. A5.8]|uniref:alpha/beta hydrolase n=1 Tax=Ancylobacter gelatini TaxID=2919920 RepID=UPI001F4DAA53|nr:alpha/beta hydrolase [Ancylobacter gelatini]MCJ8142865.1 alpha/beta hydrolase [Ancylobacter gelatini]
MSQGRSDVSPDAAGAAARPPLAIARQGAFHAGGSYTRTVDGQVMTGQMFVQFQIPAALRHPYPVVMVHGGGQTGVNFLSTPDGREGWADYFLRQGHAVYVVDQVGRGRSGYVTEVYGPTRRPNTTAIADRFSDPRSTAGFPQAARHTRWPGGGRAGDPVFDQFFASQVEDMADGAAIEALNRAALAAVLDRIGPAVLLMHSQAGAIGWGIADDRPEQVKALLAIEPNGPPLHEVKMLGAPDWFEDGPVGRPYGITRTPLAYDPPVATPGELALVREAEAQAPDLVHGWLQLEPARRLPNLARVPILIVTAEASYHAGYDHCTARYLTQAGVPNEFVRLADVGIRGNGHMMMLETNNEEIAAFLDGWITRTLG